MDNSKKKSIKKEDGYLYLISNYQQLDGSFVRCLKIGFTRTKFNNSRANGYISHNGPSGFKLLGTKQGSNMYEKMIHVFLSRKALKHKNRTEWYLYSKKIFNIFFTTTENELGKFLWENRLEYLTDKNPNSRQKKVFDYLREKYFLHKNNDTDRVGNLTAQLDEINSILSNFFDTNKENDNVQKSGDPLTRECLININKLIG